MATKKAIKNLPKLAEKAKTRFPLGKPVYATIKAADITRNFDGTSVFTLTLVNDELSANEELSLPVNAYDYTDGLVIDIYEAAGADLDDDVSKLAGKTLAVMAAKKNGTRNLRVL